MIPHECANLCLTQQSRIAVLETEMKVTAESRKEVLAALLRIEEQTRQMTGRVAKAEEEVKATKNELVPIKEAIQSFTKISDSIGKIWYVVSGGIIFVVPLVQFLLQEIFGKYFK